jgi:hypothetical protein
VCPARMLEDSTPATICCSSGSASIQTFPNGRLQLNQHHCSSSNISLDCIPEPLRPGAGAGSESKEPRLSGVHQPTRKEHLLFQGTPRPTIQPITGRPPCITTKCQMPGMGPAASRYTVCAPLEDHQGSPARPGPRATAVARQRIMGSESGSLAGQCRAVTPGHGPAGRRFRDRARASAPVCQ